jgi:hypothetical protein
VKNLFSWRLTPSENDFTNLWENAIFVFDTNFLLDLYRVSHSTAKDFLNILEHLKERIWLPNQVVSEFLNRREVIIDSEVQSFQKALTNLEKWKDEELNFNRLKGCIDAAGRIVGAEVAFLFEQQDAYKKAVEEVEKCFRGKIEELSKSHSLLNSEEDYILSKLLVLFDEKVGEHDSADVLQKIQKEGAERYSQKKPPGFMDDAKENERKYGDLIIWKQILAFAKQKSCSIVFVTSEKKEDWWNKKGGKIVSPHVELRREFKEQVDGLFWMYQTNRFLEIAKEKLELEISQESIEEANVVAETEIEEEQSYQETSQALQGTSTIADKMETIKNPSAMADVFEEIQRISGRHTSSSLTDTIREIQRTFKSYNSSIEQIQRTIEGYDSSINTMRQHNLFGGLQSARSNNLVEGLQSKFEGLQSARSNNLVEGLQSKFEGLQSARSNNLVKGLQSNAALNHDLFKTSKQNQNSLIDMEIEEKNDNSEGDVNVYLQKESSDKLAIDQNSSQERDSAADSISTEGNSKERDKNVKPKAKKHSTQKKSKDVSGQQED